MSRRYQLRSLRGRVTEAIVFCPLGRAAGIGEAVRAVTPSLKTFVSQVLTEDEAYG